MHLVKTWSRMMHIMIGTWKYACFNIKEVESGNRLIEWCFPQPVESTRAKGPCFSSPAYRRKDAGEEIFMICSTWIPSLCM